MTHVRPGRLEERAELVELQRRASLAWDDYREALLAHPEAIDVPEAQLLEGRVRVAEIANRVAGFSAVVPAADETAELDGLFVEPEHWRAGIGSALVRDACEIARSQGARWIGVTANPLAEAFYRKNGFTVVGKAQTQLGPALRMRRPA